MLELEQIILNAWPAKNTIFYDGWLICFSDNSEMIDNTIIPLYKGNLDISKKIEYCEEIFDKCAILPTFKITNETNRDKLNKILIKRGYKQVEKSYVKVFDLKKHQKVNVENININNNFSEKWLINYFKCSNDSFSYCQGKNNDFDIAKEVILNIIPDKIFIEKYIGNRVVGCAMAVIERQYIGIFDLIVAKNFRRRGCGVDIINAILNKGIDYKLDTAYLQVIMGNKGADKMYKKIGFKNLYKYWYLARE